MKEYILFLIALLCLDGLFYLEKAIRRLIKKNFSFGIFEAFSIFFDFLGIEEGQTELADGVHEGAMAFEMIEIIEKPGNSANHDSFPIIINMN